MTHPPALSPTRLARYAGYAALALLFALADLRLIVLLMSKPFLMSANVADGVVLGEPLWRVYQSRVLGPQIVHGMGAFIPLGIAYAWFAVLVLSAAGFCVMAFADRLADRSRPPVPSFLLLQAGFVFLLPCLWLYPWDLLSILMFTVFNALVLCRARPGWFVLLFALAIFNHETALFIAAWLVLDPIARALAGGRRFDWRTASLGAGLVVAGLAVIEGLRRTLLVRETQPNLELPQLVTYGKRFHYSFPQNWRSLADSFSLHVPDGLNFLVPLFLLGVVVMAVRLAIADWSRFAGLSAVTLGMVASLLLFGLVFETRVLMPLVPFVAMNVWAVFGGERTKGA